MKTAETVETVGQPVIVAGAEYDVKPGGESRRNEFSNSAGDFRIVQSKDEMKKAGFAAGQRLAKVFPRGKA